VFSAQAVSSCDFAISLLFSAALALFQCFSFLLKKFVENSGNQGDKKEYWEREYGKEPGVLQGDALIKVFE